MAHFHRWVRVGPVRVSTVKSGQGPDQALMSHTHLAVDESHFLRWGTETSERVPTSLSYTCRPLIGQQNRHSRATNKHSNRKVFLEKRRKLC